MESPEALPAGLWAAQLAAAAGLAVLVIALYYLARRLLGADHFTIEQTRPRLSRVDGTQYRVHEGHAAPQAAADTLARLNERVLTLMRWLRRRYVRGAAEGGEPGRGAEGARHPARRAAVERLLARYNPDNLAENSPKDPTGDTAYSTNKGAIVAICLRQRGSEQLHDLGVLTFVTLHEMTHIAIDAVDHPKEFWRTFRFILDEAEEAGVFTSPRYADRPVPYCGITVNYSPRHDPTLVPI